MAAHLPLLVWLSPAFPVGAFAYSHGLEWAQEAGDVTDAASLQAWLADLLEHGAARNDAILFVEAYRASELVAEEPDKDKGEREGPERLAEIAELALALASSAERRLETATQGDAFLLAIQKSWPCAAVAQLRAAWAESVAYPVAVGTAAAGHGLPLREALQAFLLGFVANLVSAAVRLGVVGQTDGQRVIAALVALVEAQAEAGLDTTLADLGGAAFRSDIAALRHETQYTRLFRS